MKQFESFAEATRRIGSCKLTWQKRTFFALSSTIQAAHIVHNNMVFGTINNWFQAQLAAWRGGGIGRALLMEHTKNIALFVVSIYLARFHSQKLLD